MRFPTWPIISSLSIKNKNLKTWGVIVLVIGMIIARVLLRIMPTNLQKILANHIHAK